MSEVYLIEPKYKKSFIAVEYFDKILSTGKKATICEHTCFRYGSMDVILSEEEYNKLKKEENGMIDFSEHDSTFNEAINSTEIWYELIDNYFTNNEIQEIKSSITEQNLEYDDSYEYWIDDCDTNFMEETGDWDLIETFYYIKGGYNVIPEKEQF